MKKVLLFPMVVAFMTLWHPTPAKAQSLFDIIDNYCFQKNDVIPDGFYECRETGEYVYPGNEGWMSLENVGHFYASDPPDPNIRSTSSAGVGIYAVCSWDGSGGYLWVQGYTIPSDAPDSLPAVVAWGKIQDPWFYSIYRQSNNGMNHSYNYPIEGSQPPIPC